jgi:putative FmdB family regulatory protein
MPLYDYVCKKCGHRFEKWVSFAQSDQTQECPDCRSLDTHRLISRVAIGGGNIHDAAAASNCGSTGRFT